MNSTNGKTTTTFSIEMQYCELPLIYRVVDWCAYRLLYTTYFCIDSGRKTNPVIDTSLSLMEALQEAVGLGGGTWIPDTFKPYWMFNYFPSLSIELLKTVDDKVITEAVSKKRLLYSAEKIWNEKKKIGQLVLFSGCT